MKVFIQHPAKVLTALLMLLLSIPAFAQSQVSGLVLDQNREPVIGATVKVKGTKTGTATDVDGKFTVSVPDKDAILAISYVGYLPMEVKASSPTLKTGIVLKENAEVIDEVVVIGYGSVTISTKATALPSRKPWSARFRA